MALKTGIGSGVVMIMAFLIGVGVMFGFLITQAEFLHPQETSVRTSIIASQWQLEQQRAQEQLAFEAQQHARELEIQSQVGMAWAEVIRTGGALVVVGFTIGLVCIMGGIGWHIATRGFLGDGTTKRIASAVRPSSANQQRASLRFPTLGVREER